MGLSVFLTNHSNVGDETHAHAERKLLFYDLKIVGYQFDIVSFFYAIYVLSFSTERENNMFRY